MTIFKSPSKSMIFIKKWKRIEMAALVLLQSALGITSEWTTWLIGYFKSDNLHSVIDRSSYYFSTNIWVGKPNYCWYDGGILLWSGLKFQLWLQLLPGSREDGQLPVAAPIDICLATTGSPIYWNIYLLHMFSPMWFTGNTNWLKNKHKENILCRWISNTILDY